MSSHSPRGVHVTDMPESLWAHARRALARARRPFAPRPRGPAHAAGLAVVRGAARRRPPRGGRADSGGGRRDRPGAPPRGRDFAVTLHGCLLAGAVAVPLDLRLGERERTEVTARCDLVADALL